MAKTFTVGVFDSGIGGLTVLAECVKLMPENRYFYLGDNFRAPYGSRSAEEITACVREALIRFARLKVDAAVLACNTATAVCAGKMRAEFDFPVVGTEPAVKPAARACRRVLVLATPRTAESERLKRLLSAYPENEFFVSAQEGLAAAVEDCIVRGKAFDLAAHLPIGKFDGVVLGCTHYVYFKEQISAFYGVPAFDGGEGTARQLKKVLCGLPEIEKTGTHDHFCGSLFLGNENANMCSGKTAKNARKNRKKGVIFVGKAKNINNKAYEHMFI